MSSSGKKMFLRFVAAAPSTYKNLTDIFSKNPAAEKIENEGKKQEIPGVASGMVQQPADDNNMNKASEKLETVKVPSGEKLASEQLIKTDTQ